MISKKITLKTNLSKDECINELERSMEHDALWPQGTCDNPINGKIKKNGFIIYRNLNHINKLQDIFKATITELDEGIEISGRFIMNPFAFAMLIFVSVFIMLGFVFSSKIEISDFIIPSLLIGFVYFAQRKSSDDRAFILNFFRTKLKTTNK
ncbi:hypothetical protein [Desulfobacula phenolica]|uniref:Uncharacterized protein n=1 Tax=Desulfobacula phenolica TaxID=90732 RepID=A0A1H2KDP5_9BACT|nr:hypothetical protein [Desulfobacula phenolica]SDU66779.1 hypothetical protein SAMN04487931_1345 [Desulfobacula phenolica]